MALFRRHRGKQKAAEGVLPLPPGVEMSRVDESAVVAAYQWGLRQTPAEVWRNQPYVRTVVTFLARNIAHLGLHDFRRVDDTDRRRIHDTPFARALAAPSTEATTFELIYGLVADYALHDRAYWLINRRTPTIRRIPSAWVVDHIASQSDPFSIEAIVVDLQDGRRAIYDRTEMVPFVGWSPLDPTGTPEPPITALRTMIAEQAAAYEFRARTWDNGLNVNRYVKRPTDAPMWSDDAKERFLEDLRATFAKKGNRVGGTPVLEEGMELHSEQFNAREAEWAEGIKLSLQMAAIVYHINPVMIGLTENSNYSNAVEFRRGLYVDTLGPSIAMIEQRINQFVRPMLTDDDDEYAEFNIAEKLEGSFEEQSQALQTATGGPWMTRAEARARMNLPPVEGADELIVPLNVAVGGLASPNDTAPPPPDALSAAARGVELKAQPPEPLVESTRRQLAEVFRRQERSLRSRTGAKAAIDDAYNDERWERELRQVLNSTGLAAATHAGRQTMARLGISEANYDESRTSAYWATKAGGLAAMVNGTVKERWTDAVSGGRSFDDVTETLTGWYAGQLAQSHVTDATGFGTVEAPKQLGVETVKTWVVTSSNPRSEHAVLNGETVAYDRTFSNGGMWPGDSSLSADQRAGCTCALSVSVR